VFHNDRKYSQKGGAIYLYSNQDQPPSNLITNCTFSGNYADKGYTLYLNSTNLELRNNTISCNFPDSIFCSHSKLLIDSLDANFDKIKCSHCKVVGFRCLINKTTWIIIIVASVCSFLVILITFIGVCICKKRKKPSKDGYTVIINQSPEDN
jgi:hypothetical protein